MRRVALAAFAVLALPSVAHAGCGVSTTRVTGAAPLTVSFTASCASAAYEWNFGDGTAGTGQTVEHVYRAGVFRPTLTSDAGPEPEPAGTVLSIALRLRGPAKARYAAWVTLRAAVTPRLPVTLRGRRFVHGKLRVRVLGTAPWVAGADGVTSTVHIVAVPKLVVRLVGDPVVGSRVRVTATLHPASAGKVVGPTVVDTHSPHIARVTVSTHARPGWAAVHSTVHAEIVLPRLSPGSHGASVLQLEEHLRGLHYAVQVDGVYGDDDVEAIYAFQKVEGLPRTGTVTPQLWTRLLRARIPRARFPGNHIEVDKTRQVLFVVREWGGRAHRGRVDRRNRQHPARAVARLPQGDRLRLGALDYPNYFLRGFAVHGYPDVPPYPASHGCVRIPMWVATRVYSEIALGSAIDIYA